jgi:hypothetical protein
MRDPVQKITTAERAGDITLVVEHLPSKCEALSSNLNTTTKIKKKFDNRTEKKEQFWHRI